MVHDGIRDKNAMKHKIAGIGVLALVVAAIAPAQFISNAPQSRAAASEAVQYLFPEQITLPAGKPATVALHFRVAQGLHVNSHTPSDDFLIPTTFSIPAGAGARLESATYPSGTTITLPADPKTRLNVYTGDFTIQAHLLASPGDHLVQARLRYQACDQRQCMPPKTIPVAIDIIGK